MATVRYEVPRSVNDAIRLMQADPDARVLAGGTDLLIQFRAGVRQPSAFVDVKLIPELVEIAVREDGARIGASVPATTICAHPTVKEWWPGLVEAVHLIGSTQIQGRASIGGNLCNGSPAADSTCALIVNRAECIIAGPGGERRVPVEQFCSAPGRTVLQRGELLIAVDLPRPQPGTADAYLRLIPRTEMDIAVAGAAVAVTLDRTGRCTTARVAIGAVAPTALLVSAAGEALVGAMFGTSAGASSALTDIKDALVGAIFATGGGTSSGPAAFDKTLVGAAFEEALTRAADLARAAARPIDDKRGTAAYRRHVVGVLVKRAAATAAARAKGQRA